MPECRTNCSEIFRHSSVKSVKLLDGRFIVFNWAKNFKFRKILDCMVRSCDIVSSICLFESSRSLFFCIKLAFHRANSSTIKLWRGKENNSIREVDQVNLFNVQIRFTCWPKICCATPHSGWPNIRFAPYGSRCCVPNSKVPGPIAIYLRSRR